MVYVLGHKVAHFSVQAETHVWWNGGWQLQLHRVNALQPAKLTVGGQSLPVGDETYRVKLQGLQGFTSSDIVRHDASDRTHILAGNSEYPILTTDVEGEARLVCLAYCGKGEPEQWQADSLDDSGVVLKSDRGAEWRVSFE